MINIVEMMAGEDEIEPCPCKFGNIVSGHACYCHSEDAHSPRKCPVWRNGWDWKRLPWLPDSPHIKTWYGENDPRNVYEIGPEWPEGGCPLFEASES